MIEIYCGDCLVVLKDFDSDSVDTIITDPPYGIGFMGSKWDYGLPDAGVWRECFRVAKPGAHLLAASSPRTVHRLACDIEDSGFEIRTMIMWVYGSGISKGLNIGKSNGIDEWKGYNTNIKSLFEPFIVAMKPIAGNFVQNAEQYGVAGLNIDACRIASEEYVFDEGAYTTRNQRGRYPSNLILSHSEDCVCVGQAVVNESGRHNCEGKTYPGRGGIGYTTSTPRIMNKSVGANSICDIYDCAPGCPIAELDKQSGFLHSRGDYINGMCDSENATLTYSGTFGRNIDGEMRLDYDSGGGASRFFYKARVSKSERLDGLKDFFWRVDDASDDGFVRVSRDEYERLPDSERYIGNIHRTVKPVDLMRYLARLTRPPSGGIVLDPFCGSGTTGVACVYERRGFIGIELSPVYVEIAQARIEHAKSQGVQLELL